MKTYSTTALLGTLTLAPALSAFLFLAPCASAQTVIRPGYQVADAAPVALGAAVSSLHDGSYVTFDGATVDLWNADGTHQLLLETLPAAVFASFIAVHPDQTRAIFGESSNGEIFSVDLNGAGTTLLAQAAYNYSFCFDPDGVHGWVSAALGGWGAGNDLLRLNLTTGLWTTKAHVGGPSGPVATDNQGNLYYGTQFDGWPVPPDTQNLIRFDQTLLAGTTLLTELDATVLISQLNGTSGIAIDDSAEAMFVLETDPSGATEHVLRRHDMAGNILDEVFTATAWMNGLELLPSGGSAILAPYQPVASQLRLGSTDYNFGVSERLIIESQRCTIAFSGPTSASIGPALVTVTHVPLGGQASVMLTRSSFMYSPEFEVDFGWGATTFLMTHPTLILRRTHPMDADTNGEVFLAYNQPSNMFGVVAFQAIIFDSSGQPIGTSEIVIND